MKNWEKSLSTDQLNAASHYGRNALLLSGPGTGKSLTLIRRVYSLIYSHKVKPSDILILTFTRIGALELRQEVNKELEELGKGFPYVSTLHSFALRQIIKNGHRIKRLPRPIRIADDWEEENIIFDNLKHDLSNHLVKVLPNIKSKLRKIRKLFSQLSADWETLKIDLPQNDHICRNAQFIGAWNTHRDIFGYTLRSELVYQLKKALEQDSRFTLEKKYKYVIIDEYQDLNSCDLAVIKELKDRGSEIFVAGDDDQSIYGFRYANPDGIRKYSKEYSAKTFELNTCYRCDKSILELADFVASLDPERLEKNVSARPDADNGTVELWSFDDQIKEAKWIANKCHDELRNDPNSTILILMRSDHLSRLSRPIVDKCNDYDIDCAIKTEQNELDQYMIVLFAYIRIFCDEWDSLAWYTLLNASSGIGKTTLDSMRKDATKRAKRFGYIVKNICEGNILEYPKRVTNRISEIIAYKNEIINLDGPFIEKVAKLIKIAIIDKGIRKKVKQYLNRIINEFQVSTFAELINVQTMTITKAEQELTAGAVNVMTMHRAKGLSADIVIIVAVEDEIIPGKNIEENIEDERRLLYVSITRTRHKLFLTYCDKRTGDQRFMGRVNGSGERNITRFLKDSGLKATRTRY